VCSETTLIYVAKGPLPPSLSGRRIDFVLYQRSFREAGLSLTKGLSATIWLRSEPEATLG
jgi:hypothetical protein